MRIIASTKLRLCTYLTLVLAKTVDFGLQILDLVLLLLINCYLLGNIVLSLLLLGVHNLNLRLQTLLILLTLCQLYLDVPQTLLELLNLRHRHPQLLNSLLLAHVVGRLHRGNHGRELAGGSHLL